MSSEKSVQSLCALDVYNAATAGDRLASYTLEAVWEEGGNQVTELGRRCITPCILANCDAELIVDLSGDVPIISSGDSAVNPLTGTCNRKQVSLDGIVLQAQSETWPEYGEGDIRPSDPDYMDL